MVPPPPLPSSPPPQTPADADAHLFRGQVFRQFFGGTLFSGTVFLGTVFSGRDAQGALDLGGAAFQGQTSQGQTCVGGTVFVGALFRCAEITWHSAPGHSVMSHSVQGLGGTALRLVPIQCTGPPHPMSPLYAGTVRPHPFGGGLPQAFQEEYIQSLMAEPEPPLQDMSTEEVEEHMMRLRQHNAEYYASAQLAQQRNLKAAKV